VIVLFLRLVLSAATSMRSAAVVLDLFAPYLPYVERTPVANSGRLWLLRVGLFELSREKEKAEDWVWMMDHTIQLGPWKCLIVVGLRLSSWLKERGPLSHEDLTLLNLTPMKKSTGEEVEKELRATMEKTGVPLGIVSDGGSDLKRAMDFLHEDYPQIRHLLDIKHKNALLLKKALETDDRWGRFVTRANQTKLGLTQTSLAFLNPPSLKTKARYMNLDTLVSWGVQALAYLDRPRELAGEAVDRGKLKEKLGWLREYRRDLKTWSELLEIAWKTEEHVHQEGLHPLICEELDKRLKAVVSTPSGRRFKERLFEFLSEQVSPLCEGERLIGSTEVLESIIGKYKRLQSSHSKGGMTAMLLSVGAIVGKLASDTVQHALETVSTDDVISWCKAALGTTLQAQRKLALGATKTG
jgi:hypothetical protein